jgi:type I restriction enzyme, R subunit
LVKARERLEETREAVKALCEPVAPPKDTMAYLRYFCAREPGNTEQLKANEPNRLALYRHVAAFVRAFANIANELEEAGYTAAEIARLKAEVDHYEKVRNEVKLASGDYIDLKMYEPAMRHLIDTYIRAEESEKISAFDDLSLVQLIVERGPDAVDALPKGIRENREAVAETIENNVRRLIIDEQPINPKYYERMSQLLDALIAQRRQQALDYQKYLQQIVELTKKIKNPTEGSSYPNSLNTAAKRALYDNLDRNEVLALAIHDAVLANKQDDWRGNVFKVRKVRFAVKNALETYRLAKTGQSGGVGAEEPDLYRGKPGNPVEDEVEKILELVKNQHEY